MVNHYRNEDSHGKIASVCHCFLSSAHLHDRIARALLHTGCLALHCLTCDSVFQVHLCNVYVLVEVDAAANPQPIFCTIVSAISPMFCAITSFQASVMQLIRAMKYPVIDFYCASSRGCVILMWDLCTYVCLSLCDIMSE